MLSRTARWSAAHPWRTVLMWLVIALPLALAGALGQFAVTTDDTARFLPADAPSQQALAIGRADFGLAPGTASVTVLVEDELIDVRERAGAVLSATVGPEAPDGRFVLVGLRWRANTVDPVAHSAYEQLRAALTERADRAGLETGFALAAGILIAALVVSSVLVPSLAALSVRRRDAPRSEPETEGGVP